MMIDGPAKSGKSYTALRFAFALAPSSRVCVIEAGELGSTEKYIGEEADGRRWGFDICQLDNYSPESYTEAVLEAGRQGYEAVVIDSLSAEWTGKGGALEIADKGGGPFGGWKTATPLHDKMFETILASPCHVLATVRSKMDYVLEANDRGKMEPRKVGLAPIQRDTAPYEFDILLSMDAAHVGTVSGSRCRAVDGLSVLKPGADFLKPVILWLETGVQADAPKPSPRITDFQVQRVAGLLADLRWTLDRVARDFPRKYGATELGKLTHEQAQGLIKWLEAQAGASAKKAELQQQAPASQAAPTGSSQPEAAAAPPATNGHTAPARGEPAIPPSAPGIAARDGKATNAQRQNLVSLRGELFGLLGISGSRTQETTAWTEILAKRGVTTALDLSPEQADELIGNLRKKVEQLHAERRPADETEAAAAERL
jgi:hypothetical protein